MWVSAEGDFPGYSFHQSDDPAGNPVRQDNNSFELTNTFNNLNQNATSWRCGGATILGTMNLTNGAVTVSGLPASTRTNNFGVIFMATNLLLFTGTNAYMAAFADVFSRSATSVGSVVATDRGYGYDANGKMTNDGDRLRCVRTVRQTNPLMTCACKELSGTLGGACGIGGILAMHSADSTYFHCNGNGNVIALTTTNGAVNGRDRSRRVVACPSRPRIQLYAE